MLPTLFSFTIIAIAVSLSHASPLLHWLGDSLGTAVRPPQSDLITVSPHTTGAPYSYHDINSWPKLPHTSIVTPSKDPSYVTVTPHPAMHFAPSPEGFHVIPPRLVIPNNAEPPYRLATPFQFPSASHDDFEMPRFTQVPPSDEYFDRAPALRDVAALQMSAIIADTMKPISADNVKIWKLQNEGYLGLADENKNKVRMWLQNYLVDGHRNPEYQARATAHIWSLEQLKPTKKIWWSESLIRNRDPKNNGYIDLVACGELLKFFDKNQNFKFTNEAFGQTLPKLREIFRGKQEKPRSVGLNIKELMKYQNNANVPMYQDRVGQLMKLSLKDFSHKTNDEKQRIMEDLYLFIGTSPSKVTSRAKNALQRHPESLSKLLDQREASGQDDYQRIQKELNKLGKRWNTIG